MTPKTRHRGIDADLALHAADFRSKYGWFERSKKNRSNRLNTEMDSYLTSNGNGLSFSNNNNNMNNSNNNNGHSNDSWTQRTDIDATSLLFPQEIPNIGSISTNCTDAAKSKKYKKARAKSKAAKTKVSASQTFVENQRSSFVSSCLEGSNSQGSRRSTRLANNKNKAK